MAEARISSKYQLVIPKEIREGSGLKIGEKIIILNKDGIINLIPQHMLKKMRGFIKGIKTTPFREEKERL